VQKNRCLKGMRTFRCYKQPRVHSPSSRNSSFHEYLVPRMPITIAIWIGLLERYEWHIFGSGRSSSYSGKKGSSSPESRLDITDVENHQNLAFHTTRTLCRRQHWVKKSLEQDVGRKQPHQTGNHQNAPPASSLSNTHCTLKSRGCGLQNLAIALWLLLIRQEMDRGLLL
jgi:hypothetical protein